MVTFSVTKVEIFVTKMKQLYIKKMRGRSKGYRSKEGNKLTGPDRLSHYIIMAKNTKYPHIFNSKLFSSNQKIFQIYNMHREKTP